MSSSELDSVSQHVNLADSTLTSFLTLVGSAPYSVILYPSEERESCFKIWSGHFSRGGLKTLKYYLYTLLESIIFVHACLPYNSIYSIEVVIFSDFQFFILFFLFFLLRVKTLRLAFWNDGKRTRVRPKQTKGI